MSYRLLRQDAHPGWWQALAVEGVSLRDLFAGLPMHPAPPPAPVRVTVAAGGRSPSDFLGLPTPVVSDAMRRALETAGVDNVEYFPAHVYMQYTDDALATDYWAVNVLGAIACAAPLELPAGSPDDPGNEGHTEPARGFRIDARRAHGVDLFRLAEDRELIVVSERVVAALRAAGLRGLVLQDPESYTEQGVGTAPLPDAAPRPHT